MGEDSLGRSTMHRLPRDEEVSVLTGALTACPWSMPRLKYIRVRVCHVLCEGGWEVWEHCVALLVSLSSSSNWCNELLIVHLASSSACSSFTGTSNYTVPLSNRMGNLLAPSKKSNSRCNVVLLQNRIDMQDKQPLRPLQLSAPALSALGSVCCLMPTGPRSQTMTGQFWLSKHRERRWRTRQRWWAL